MTGRDPKHTAPTPCHLESTPVTRPALPVHGGCIHLADGALGTNFIADGLDLTHDCAESWNLSHPDKVLGLARAFTEAGARIITTNTFGGNRLRLEASGRADQLAEINRRGVALARAGASPNSWVAASMGPTGCKDISARSVAIRDAYAEQVDILVDGGPDLLLLETMTSPDEARLALEVVREKTDIPAICSFAFRQRGANRFSTWSGDSVGDAVGVARQLGCAMVGVNCYPADDTLGALLHELHGEAGDLPLWVKPNAGAAPGPQVTHAYQSPVHRLPVTAQELIHFHVAVLGGCCGTTPEHLHHLAARLAPYAPPAYT